MKMYKHFNFKCHHCKSQNVEINNIKSLGNYEQVSWHCYDCNQNTTKHFPVNFKEVAEDEKLELEAV